MFVLVPLIITIIIMLAISDTVGRVVVGCSGVALAVLILIPTGIVTSIWCKKAITICVARAAGARDALRQGWREFRADLGRHLAVAVIVVRDLDGAEFAGVRLHRSDEHQPEHQHSTSTASRRWRCIFAPVRVIVGVIQGMIGAAISSFFLACFVSMTEER